MNKETLWQNLVNFINSLDDATVFTRKDLMTTLDTPRSETTIDTYRRILTVIGYLSEDGRGQYKKNMSIPEYMTSSIAQKQAYS